MDYQPMTIAKLAAYVAAEADFDVRWRLVVEFLKEYHHEPAGKRQQLLADAPGPTGDERWDVLLAGLAEHLTTRDGQGAPGWSASRGLRRFWFPFDAPGAKRHGSVSRNVTAGAGEAKVSEWRGGPPPPHSRDFPGRGISFRRPAPSPG